MKTIGLIGGMSWESSLLYYQIINQSVKARLGGHHSAKSLMYSLDFEEIKSLQQLGNWDDAAKMMIEAAQKLQAGGADCIVICTNTMHKMASEVEESASIPLLHIADATANEMVKDGIKKVALLGTAYTMEQNFYKGRLIDKFGLDIMVPNEAERRIVHEIIYQELCLGIINEESKQSYVKIINNLIQQGAEGVILGCTEIGLLISQHNCSIPVYDTTRLHAQCAVDFALSEG
ncbi:aspartate/glutamate racemase family protein [Paenibacillus apiarius]|uniref:Aspartate/glutamate racemase family protein n=1 Tax=Paenibacillus apiarius TaxID=46240 RepID=A0ABT4DQF1_9BACL|nr:aspartate/glutamate racemase family protein [Paenibacillus apiarius]MCY9516322.1 aspartate/glutamate racemase family protein [Paenibacillus apiarius]MCY9519580.1 aspartate/glutamate racemase family protein [Paenibacillus apiarius]MCY9554658.1 aspartate/glutamate racemase family protein [Paenibacillus apiarius]MCY9561515.1 aspartate/glutamate racemase family protein [Paenibacillus apiarius]MCY9684254.1 aspartate/glutamate racemase family protein [Paenibacillus apiarius]